MELQDLIKKESDGIIVVDVRDPLKYAEGHIPGAINIPSEIFASKSDVQDKKANVDL